MKKNTQLLVEKLAQYQSEIDKLNGDMVRCKSIVSTAGIQDAGIEALKAKRATENANALIDQRAADTASIDSEIVKLQKASAKALLDREAASSAIPIIESRIQAVAMQAESIRDQLNEAVTTDILAQHDSAQERYFAAIESMGDAVKAMVASEKTWRHVLRPAPGAQFPGRGAAVLDDIRTGGLRVRWDHSMLRDPAVASEYVPGFESSYFVPWWADERNIAFADADVAASVENFQAAGFPCTPYEAKQAPVSEVRVVVQLVRGTFEQSDFKISASTGKMVSVGHTVFGPGETVVLGEKDAARFVVHGSAKYVDGRSKASAYQLLNPNSPVPAHIQADQQDDQGSAPRSRDDEPKINVRYEGYPDGEIPETVNRFTPGLVRASSR